MAINPAMAVAGRDAEIQGLKNLAKQSLPILKGIGISVGVATAASALVPDHAVMTKDEIDNDVQLSNTELMIRKSAVPLIVRSLLHAPGNLIQVGRMLKAPGVETKVRATAKMMASVPGWYTAYKVLKHKYETGEGTLNIRHVTTGAPLKTLGTIATLGAITDGVMIGSKLSDAVDAMKTGQV